jgi:hypothetical protein
MMKPILTVLLVSAGAFAQPAGKPASRPLDSVKLTGAKAQRLMLALKLAGIKPVKDKGKWTWSVKSMFCPVDTDDDGDGLQNDKCQVDAKKLTGAAAYALVQGMLEIGVQSDEGGGLTLELFSCVDDPAALSHRGEQFNCLVGRGNIGAPIVCNGVK